MSIPDMQRALEALAHATVTTWNRLEGRPRARDLGRALRAEVRDPLWMIARQWQLGEFRGEDAGSPAKAQVLIESEPLTRYQPGAHAPDDFPTDLPLEAVVERRDPELTLDLRLAMGRRWMRSLKRAGLGTYASAYLSKYGFAPPDPTRADQAEVCAHPRVWQRFAAAAGRTMDGGALYAHLVADPSHTAHDEVAVDPADQSVVADLGAKLVEWVRRWIEPAPSADQDAWVPDRLEYQCAIESGPAGGDRFEAREYHHGDLAWYNFDRGSGSTGPAPDAPVTGHVQPFLPTSVKFDGMPHPRWWQLEDGRTDFGAVDASTTDLARLLFIEFGLVYANDWFLLPHPVEVGRVVRVRGLTVTNVFGERVWIEPAGTAEGEVWQQWRMYGSSTPDGAGHPSELLVLPTVPKIQAAQSTERVMLIRDEMANQVWGIERDVRLASGIVDRGAEVAAQTFDYHHRLITGSSEPDPLPDARAPIRYRVMTQVPEHWIPFVPIHEAGSDRQTKLQRAAMLRIIEGAPGTPDKVRPRTSVLRHGLPSEPYFIAEEEVPRAGATVVDGFQRTRWYGGKVVLWRGLAKHTGRGEGSSGLAFDRLFPAKKEAEPQPIPEIAKRGAPHVLETPPFPSVSLEATADPAGGWNLSATIENFILAPHHASGPHVHGEGHMHLYVNGIKLTRVYSPRFHLRDLPIGTHRLRLELSTNAHKSMTAEGVRVDASTTVTQGPPPPAPPGDRIAWSGPAPTVMLMAHPDPVAGWNLHVQTTHFWLTPENASGPHATGAGHFELLLNGNVLARLYGAWYHLPPLKGGDHTVAVRLVTNDHRVYEIGGAPVQHEITLSVVDNAPTGGHGH